MQTVFPVQEVFMFWAHEVNDESEILCCAKVRKCLWKMMGTCKKMLGKDSSSSSWGQLEHHDWNTNKL